MSEVPLYQRHKRQRNPAGREGVLHKHLPGQQGSLPREVELVGHTVLGTGSLSLSPSLWLGLSHPLSFIFSLPLSHTLSASRLTHSVSASRPLTHTLWASRPYCAGRSGALAARTPPAPSRPS